MNVSRRVLAIMSLVGLLFAGFATLPAAALAAPARTLIVSGVYCAQIQEVGSDEIDLYVIPALFGKKLGPYLNTDCGPHEWLTTNLSFAMGSTGLMLQMQEDDGNKWLDPNDVIGTNHIPAQRTNGTRTLTFRGDGAMYVLYYRVQ